MVPVALLWEVICPVHSPVLTNTTTKFGALSSGLKNDECQGTTACCIFLMEGLEIAGEISMGLAQNRHREIVLHYRIKES